MTFEEWADRTFGGEFKTDEMITYFRMSAAWENGQKECANEFSTAAIEAIYAAWHGAGVDIAGGNWERFVGMLPISNAKLTGAEQAPLAERPR